METSQLKKSYIIMPPYWRYSVRFVADFVVIVLYCYRIVTFVFVYIAVRCRCVTLFVTVIVSYRCTYRCHCCRTLLVLLRYYCVREHVVIDIVFVFVFVFVYVYVAIVSLHARVRIVSYCTLYYTYSTYSYTFTYVFVFVITYIAGRVLSMWWHMLLCIVILITCSYMYCYMFDNMLYVLTYV